MKLTKLTLLLWLSLIIGLAGMIGAQFSLSKFNQLTTIFLQKPFDQQINLEINRVLTASRSQLADEFITRIRSTSDQSDWQAIEEQIKSFQQKQQQLSEAVAYWQNLDNLYPDFPAIKLILAGYFYQKGDKQTAHKYLNQAKALDPNNKFIGLLESLITSEDK